MQERKYYGPYKHRGLWRVHIVTGSGSARATRYRSFESRDEADAYTATGRTATQGTTVRQAVEALLETMRKNENAESTITTNEFRLWHFFQLARHGDRPVRWLRNRGEELYDAAQKDRDADTHQPELALAKRLGALCVKKRWLTSNPFEHVEPVGKKTHGSDLPRHSTDEARKLREFCLAEPGDQHRLVTLAYLLLGARASELVKRSVRDLDDGGSLLRIGKTKTRTGTRKLTLPDELRLPLLELVRGRAPDAPIFTKEDGKRATRHWAYHHVRRICGEAKVTVLSAQGLRRTQSDMATEAGESAIAVARHLGHKSTRVTDRSYRDPNVVAAAKQDAAFRVLAGGKR
jgi:integrase